MKNINIFKHSPGAQFLHFTADENDDYNDDDDEEEKEEEEEEKDKDEEQEKEDYL